MTCGPCAFSFKRHSVLCLCSSVMCIASDFNVGLEYVFRRLPFIGFPCRNQKLLDERCPHVECLRVLHALCTWPGTPTLKELSGPSCLELRHITVAIWQQCSTTHFVSQTVGSVAWIINNNYLHVALSNDHNNQAKLCFNACGSRGHFREVEKKKAEFIWR